MTTLICYNKIDVDYSLSSILCTRYAFSSMLTKRLKIQFQSDDAAILHLSHNVFSAQFSKNRRIQNTSNFCCLMLMLVLVKTTRQLEIANYSPTIVEEELRRPQHPHALSLLRNDRWFTSSRKTFYNPFFI